MNGEALNLFIVDDNKLSLLGLHESLKNHFGDALIISTFISGKSALECVNKNTSIVILDYLLEGENGNEILEAIKKINPKTEVIMLSSSENLVVAIESFRKGATDYVVKGGTAWGKLIPHVYHKITEPIRKMGREYGVKKFISIFIIVFVLMALLVAILYQCVNHVNY